MRWSRLFLWFVTASLVTVVAIPVSSMLARRSWHAEALVSITAVALAFGLAGYVFTFAIEQGKLRPWMVSGLIAGGLALLTWSAAIWHVDVTYDDAPPLLLLWIGTPASGWAGLMMLVGMTALMRVTARWAIITRRITIALAASLLVILSGSICYWPVLEEDATRRQLEAYFQVTSRASGILAILTGCGMLALLTASALPRLGRDEVPLSERTRFAVFCPRCGTGQTILTDGDACAACGLHIKVTAT
jgi:hypothetical protein